MYVSSPISLAEKLGGPLKTCMKEEEVWNYNRNKSKRIYVGPISSLFCVEVDNAPEMGVFYDQVSSIQPEDVNTIINTSSKLSSALYSTTTTVNIEPTYSVIQKFNFFRLETNYDLVQMGCLEISSFLIVTYSDFVTISKVRSSWKNNLPHVCNEWYI
jgi:hypothetical protein